MLGITKLTKKFKAPLCPKCGYELDTLRVDERSYREWCPNDCAWEHPDEEVISRVFSCPGCNEEIDYNYLLSQARQSKGG